MNERPEWFAPKRYGYGAGLPITWQGWVVSLAFVGAMIGLALLIGDRPLQFIAATIPLVVVFTAILAKTTRGGWRWRWGQADDESTDR
jgi:hypothetical protein